MNKRLTTLVCVICLLLSLCGCSDTVKSRPSDCFYTFTDSIGNEVTLSQKPEKVAVLFSSLCNVWINAGGEVSVTVGESIERGLCGKNVQLVDSGAGKSINTELLMSYEPDFVIYSSDVPAQRECAQFLTASGIPSAAIRLDSFTDYLYALEIFCNITGSKANYELYGKNQQQEIDLIKQNALSQKEKPVILFARSGSSMSSFKAKSAKDNFAAKMLEELCCVNIADSAPVLLDGISTEVILKENPGYVFVSIMGDEKAGKQLTANYFNSEAMSTLTSEIVYLPKELFQYKPCENWAKAYEFLYEKLYG